MRGQGLTKILRTYIPIINIDRKIEIYLQASKCPLHCNFANRELAIEFWKYLKILLYLFTYTLKQNPLLFDFDLCGSFCLLGTLHQIFYIIHQGI